MPTVFPKGQLALYVLIFALAYTGLIAAIDYLQLNSSSSFSVVEIFLEATLCLYACIAIGGLKAVTKKHPQTTTSALMRYVLLIGGPSALSFVILALAITLLGMSDALQIQATYLVLGVVSGLIFFILATLFGLSLPGALREPKDTIGEAFQRGKRQASFTLPRLLFFMAPFSVAAFALSVAAAATGLFGNAPAGTMIFSPNELLVTFVVKLLGGMAIVAFAAIIMAAFQKDEEERLAEAG
ncbi:hypothetical protein J0X15_16595 [Roseibium sp. CAU 1637]|uniref:Uncharacterized protein n=1 Tax=Roseibium limicola TaxID=2816037 RepID=A0A939ESL1_9HYPH|nr:hypothetical protein [Roseibium limicola]MBO0346848.1 hypothetical protein [Roseibium limicola]